MVDGTISALILPYAFASRHRALGLLYSESALDRVEQLLEERLVLFSIGMGRMVGGGRAFERDVIQRTRSEFYLALTNRAPKGPPGVLDEG